MHNSLPFLLFIICCGLSSCVGDKGSSGINEQMVAEGGPELKCKLSRGDSSKRFRFCHCFEVAGLKDTISEGHFLIDSLERTNYRFGWHTFFSDTGFIRMNYSLMNNSNGTYEEHQNQVVYLRTSGDTIFDRSRFVRSSCQDTIRIGEPLNAAFEYVSSGKVNFFHFNALVERVNDSAIVTLGRKVEYVDRFFTYDTLLRDTGRFELQAYIFGAVEVANGDSLEVVKTYLRCPIVVTDN